MLNNDRFVQITKEPDHRPDWRQAPDRPEVPDGLPGTEAPSLTEVMRMTREEWDVWTRGSAIRRAGYAGFKRNVAAAGELAGFGRRAARRSPLGAAGRAARRGAVGAGARELGAGVRHPAVIRAAVYPTGSAFG